jgi:hypothetical protein
MREAALIVMLVLSPWIAKPMLPKRRPNPPLRSRKPRCSLAGTVTVTFAEGGERLNLSLPRFFRDRAFRTRIPE